MLAIADGYAGHACIMPMQRVGAEWKPTESGWGLIDACSHLLVNPSTWFVGDAGPEWVIVRAVRYPETEAYYPPNMADITAQPGLICPWGFAQF